MKTYTTFDEYIKNYPSEIQEILKKLRKLIREVAPDAQESISYGIPTFKTFGKYMIYFAGFKNHVSIYPILSPDKKLFKKIEPYIKGRGTLQFPLDKPIPYELIREVALARKKENIERYGNK